MLLASATMGSWASGAPPRGGESSAERISIGLGGAPANGASGEPSVSRTGRWVAFSSAADNLVEGDTNSASDIFVRDRLVLTTTRVSIATGGLEATGNSIRPSISPDGRYVVFESEAALAGAEPGVFIHDLQTRTTTLVAAGGRRPCVSEGGRFVAYDLLEPGTTPTSRVFVRDRQLNTTQIISLDDTGMPLQADSLGATMSADGRYIAFSESGRGVLVRDRVAARSYHLNTSGAGAVGNSPSGPIRIAGKGMVAVFASNASNLVASDTNAASDIFINAAHASSDPQRISVATGGRQASGTSTEPDVSDNGRFAVFKSDASDLASGTGLDLFVRDHQDGITTRVSATLDDIAATAFHPRISGNGKWITFSSEAANLAAGDTNGAADVFIVQSPLAPSPGIIESVEPGFAPRGRTAVAIIHGTGFAGTLPPNLPTTLFAPGVTAATQAASPVSVAVRLRIAGNTTAGGRNVTVTNSDGAESDALVDGFIVTTLPARGVLSVTAPRFTRTMVGATSEAEVTVSNRGKGTLVVQPSRLLRITGPFTLEDPYLPVRLAPKGRDGSRHRFMVRFTPTAPGKARGRLTLLSDDPKRKNYVVPLSGTGAATQNGPP